MEKLPISAGILAWRSGQTLVDTLSTYYSNGLLSMLSETTILFQEVTDEDRRIADHFGIPYIGLNENIGIGQAFIKLAKSSIQPYFLTLEHDWQLIESQESTWDQLSHGIQLIQSGISCVRYRHRKHPGYPHFSFRHMGRELEYYDEEIGCTSPHLLDSIHWTEHPDQKFEPHIQQGKFGFYTTTSRYGNWTNNPCLYPRYFYLSVVEPFAGSGIALEGNISKWWAQQTFGVAHGEGLFMHRDARKYGNLTL